jgi:NAD(P)H-nitrite reductase large subunit
MLYNSVSATDVPGSLKDKFNRMEDIEICLCNNVMRSVIIKSFEENGLKTLEEVQDKTTAGTVCGGCIPDIEEILSTMNTNSNINKINL